MPPDGPLAAPLDVTYSDRTGLARLDGKALLIFAGKGGVGKTTCSAATALHYAESGRKTLLVTVDPAKRLEDSLGVPLDSGATEVRPNLYASMLDPEEIIRAKLENYTEGAKVMDHPLFRYVTNYLPGLNELMAIGRLNEVRHEAAYDLIVIDTAPTGHALSFLSAPKAIQELMSEKSLIRWALRGYTMWQRFQKASRGIGRLLGKKKDDPNKASAPETPGETDAPDGDGPDERISTEEARKRAEDIDLEEVFRFLAQEAREIQEMLTDPDRTALNIVTLPEKLPIEETIDLFEHAVREIGIHVGTIIVNKVQPDALGDAEDDFFRLIDDAATQERMGAQLVAAGYPAALFPAMVRSTEFSDLRRRMNLTYIDELRARLPTAHQIQLPLFKEDVEGLRKLSEFKDTMYRAQ